MCVSVWKINYLPCTFLFRKKGTIKYSCCASRKFSRIFFFCSKMLFIFPLVSHWFYTAMEDEWKKCVAISELGRICIRTRRVISRKVGKFLQASFAHIHTNRPEYQKANWKRRLISFVFGVFFVCVSKGGWNSGGIFFSVSVEKFIWWFCVQNFHSLRLPWMFSVCFHLIFTCNFHLFQWISLEFHLFREVPWISHRFSWIFCVFRVFRVAVSG